MPTLGATFLFVMCLYATPRSRTQASAWAEMDRYWAYRGPDYVQRAVWQRLAREGYFKHPWDQWPEEIQEATESTFNTFYMCKRLLAFVEYNMVWSKWAGRYSGYVQNAIPLSQRTATSRYGRVTAWVPALDDVVTANFFGFTLARTLPPRDRSEADMIDYTIQTTYQEAVHKLMRYMLPRSQHLTSQNLSANRMRPTGYVPDTRQWHRDDMASNEFDEEGFPITRPTQRRFYM